MATPEPDPALSRDSTWSTISPDPDVVADQNPPPGPQAIETLGTPGSGPKEREPEATTSTKSSKASS
jgi:hypothetical protein